MHSPGIRPIHLTKKGHPMAHFVPYLCFDGNCAQAMRFYEQVLHARIEMMMTGGDSPMADQMADDFKDRIMHACLLMPDGSELYASDNPPGMAYEGFKGVSITMNYDTVAEAERVFQALSEGGQVTMPLAPTFWAKTFGMLIDPFGVPWIINGESLPMPQ